MQEKVKDMAATGGQVVAISYDSVAILKRFAAKRSITFPLLSDAGSKTIDAFGIRNQEAPERWSGIPYPGTFILDQKGVIRAKLFLENYRERHPTEAVIQVLKNAR
ncbi:MAG: peroxiredoxin family protein [Chloroflexi bacterium]|nr:peroxiredoxin family protein [Chloroflexota bacterium]